MLARNACLGRLCVRHTDVVPRAVVRSVLPSNDEDEHDQDIFVSAHRSRVTPSFYFANDDDGMCTSECNCILLLMTMAS